jgi:hypothetical protein
VVEGAGGGLVDGGGRGGVAVSGKLAWSRAPWNGSATSRENAIPSRTESAIRRHGGRGDAGLRHCMNRHLHG